MVRIRIGDGTVFPRRSEDGFTTTGSVWLK
jgi:hypothetical protein